MAKSRFNPVITPFKLPELPGFGPDIGGLLRIKANNRLIARRAQLACDIGLFSDEADQLDLVEMFQDPVED
jgi:hypothetical protein